MSDQLATQTESQAVLQNEVDAKEAERLYQETGNVYYHLKARGFFKQCTHEEEVIRLLGEEKVTFYIGFDPTADSLHIGHYLTLAVASHLQKAGHRPIILVGGGTGHIGDPSGRTDLRQVMTSERIQQNVNSMKQQMMRFVDFSDDKALLVDNADWLLKLNYVDFLRDIGACFSVNRMLTAECYRQRMEKGLTFLEFNYMLMQGYDFLELYRRYGCLLEVGGDDQWSNILAGVDLLRRKEQKEAYGLTVTLLTNAQGQKMGKTASGAVWLDAQKFSPYDFYQYFRNVGDAEVLRLMKLLTFMTLEEIEHYAGLQDQAINEAKVRLAYEVTKIVHGEGAANEAKQRAEAAFGAKQDTSSMPTSEISAQDLETKALLDSLLEAALIPSKGEGRRLMQQGGITLNGQPITEPRTLWSSEHFIEATDGEKEAVVKRGKKVFHRFILK